MSVLRRNFMQSMARITAENCGGVKLRRDIIPHLVRIDVTGDLKPSDSSPFRSRRYAANSLDHLLN